MPHPKERLSPQLDYEGWRDLLRSMCGRYYSEGVKPASFSGWVRPVNVRGFTALDIGSNAQRVERTYQDAATARTITSRCFPPVASWQ
jgi:AraC family transcriptional regulator, positive regulator of tynA and feaB